MKVMYFGIQRTVITVEYKNIFGKKKIKDITRCTGGYYTPRIVENEEEGEKEFEELKNYVIERDTKWARNNFNKDIKIIKVVLEDWHRFEELQGKKLEELFKLMTPEEFKKEFGYLIVEV